MRKRGSVLLLTPLPLSNFSLVTLKIFKLTLCTTVLFFSSSLSSSWALIKAEEMAEDLDDGEFSLPLNLFLKTTYSLNLVKSQRRTTMESFLGKTMAAKISLMGLG